MISEEKDRKFQMETSHESELGLKLQVTSRGMAMVTLVAPASNSSLRASAPDRPNTSSSQEAGTLLRPSLSTRLLGPAWPALACSGRARTKVPHEGVGRKHCFPFPNWIVPEHEGQWSC